MLVAGEKNKDGSGVDVKDEVQGFVFSQLKYVSLVSYSLC